jgi:hypothetical protein
LVELVYMCDSYVSLIDVCDVISAVDSLCFRYTTPLVMIITVLLLFLFHYILHCIYEFPFYLSYIVMTTI